MLRVSNCIRESRTIWIVMAILRADQNNGTRSANHLQSVASGVWAFTNEFMTTYAAQCHLNIGKRRGVQVLLLAGFLQILGVAAKFVDE